MEVPPDIILPTGRRGNADVYYHTRLKSLFRAHRRCNGSGIGVSVAMGMVTVTAMPKASSGGMVGISRMRTCMRTSIVLESQNSGGYTELGNMYILAVVIVLRSLLEVETYHVIGVGLGYHCVA